MLLGYYFMLHMLTVFALPNFLADSLSAYGRFHVDDPINVYDFTTPQQKNDSLRVQIFAKS